MFQHSNKIVGQVAKLLIPLWLVLIQGSILSIRAEVSQAPSHVQVYSVSSGTYNGNGHDEIIAYTTQVQVTNAGWLRVHFASTSLGNSSYITLTSVLDGGQQRLTSTTLVQWQNSTAYFNGNAVDIALHVAPNDLAINFTVDNVVVGDPNLPLGIQSQCGPTDDRVASNNPRVGRLLNVGCTAWLIPSGILVTAGHCVSTSSLANVLEFNVPLSASDGTIRHSSPNDQYAVNASSITYHDNGIGDDWGTFEVSPNSNTGLLPLAAQGASFTVVQNLGPSTIRITGYGTDAGTANQTQQTSTGPNAGSSGTVMRYQTDTEGGNSGSPVIDEATGNAVGVHTNGGCTTGGGGNNSGTSTFNTSLWNAITTSVQVTVRNEFKDPNNSVMHGGIVNVDNTDINTDPLGGVYTTTFIQNSPHRFEAKEQPYGTYYRGFNNLSGHGGGWLYPNGSLQYFAVINPQVQAGNYTAKYRNRYNVAATAAKCAELVSGGTYKVNGTNVGATWNENVWQYQSVSLEAVPPSGPDWFFAQWSDGTTQNPYYLIPTDHTDLYAIFKKHLASSVPSATGSNNQRKLVRDMAGALHAVYESGGEIWYSTSTNLGVTWSNETLVSDGAGSNFFPTIDIAVITAGTPVQEVHIAWIYGLPGDYSVLYRKKSGSSWGTIEGASSSVTLTAPTPALSATPCAVGAAPTNTTLPYCLTNADADYFYLAYKPSGSGWANLSIYGYNNGPVSAPSVQIKGSNLAFAFLDNGRISYNEVGPLCLPLSSSSFLYSPHVDASAGDGMTNRGAPSLFIDPTSISPLWIAYEAIDPAYSSTLKVIVVRKKDGATWQTSKELKYPIASSLVSYTNPSISGAGTNLSVTFQSNNNDVYVARYDGSTWNEPSLKEYGVINSSISITKNPGAYSDNCILSTSASGPPYAIQPLTRPGTPTAPKVLPVAGSDGIYHPRLSWNIFYEPNLQSHKIYRRYYYASTGEYTTWGLRATLGSTVSSWTDMGVDQYVPDPHGPYMESDQAEYYIQAVNTLSITSYESNHVVADVILPAIQKRAAQNRPVMFALDANFPNPFNPSTTIRYAVPEDVHVTLKVYDVLGREVATLVDEFKYTDFYEVTFNASNLPTGMYYYRLTAGKFTQVKKMLLAK